MMELLSVIIPLYNGKKYIVHTVDNILKSTYTNIEVVIVNDGSTDDSYNVVKHYYKDNDRVRIFTKQNGGIASTRNFGLEQAKGKYVCFVDQDDYVEPFMYEEMINQIIQDSSQCCVCGTGRIINNKKIPFESFENCKYVENEIVEKILLPFIFMDTSYLHNKPIIKRTSIWKFIIEREFLKDIQFSFKRFINYEDDYIFNVEILLNLTSLSMISYVGYYWYMNVNSESFNKRYINDIIPKCKNYREYLYKKLSNSKKIDSHILQDFNFQFICKDILRIIKNESFSDHSFSKKISTIKKYVEDNKEALQFKKYYTKSSGKNKIILDLVAKKHYIGAYIFNSVYFFLKKFSVFEQVRMKLEILAKGE